MTTAPPPNLDSMVRISGFVRFGDFASSASILMVERFVPMTRQAETALRRSQAFVIAKTRFKVVATRDGPEQWKARSNCSVPGCEQARHVFSTSSLPSAELAIAVCVARIREHYIDAHS